MPPDLALAPTRRLPAIWPRILLQGAAGWLALGLLTFNEWRQMAHQWWNIDTYNHVLLIPAVLAWLVWLRRAELRQVAPSGWWPGLLWLGGSLLVWLVGRALEVNLIAQAGVVGAFQGATVAIFGWRVAILLAFPLVYALFLVPFGDELIPVLQALTARMAIAFTHLSGVPAVIDGLLIDTPAGRFVVAEECAGVKFLIAMIALCVLVGWTGFRTWKPRLVLVMGAAVISIVANGIRAWGTIFAAQHIGIERAGGFDHIVYGWVFFAVVIAAVLGLAWRHFDREPEQAGLTARDIDASGLAFMERYAGPPHRILAGVLSIAIGFAALAAVV